MPFQFLLPAAKVLSIAGKKRELKGFSKVLLHFSFLQRMLSLSSPKPVLSEEAACSSDASFESLV